MKRKGISLLSVVIYVVLFFTFMSFATIIATNMNYTSLTYKGRVLNSENFEKLQYNLINSAKASTSIENINGNIVFSNGDSYIYDAEKKVVIKNGTNLVFNVTSFELVGLDELTNVPDTFTQKENDVYINIDESKSYICLNIALEKYGSTNNFQIFTVAGDDV